MVVLKTQELAGIDVVADGELKRFDPSHPETNGMIDYFVTPHGRHPHALLARPTSRRFRADARHGYRADPAGIVVGDDRRRHAQSAARLRVHARADAPAVQVHLHRPAHAGQGADEPALSGNRRELAMAIAEVLRRQLEPIDAAVVQLDEANISGHPAGRASGPREAINHVLDGIRGRAGGAHLLRQLRRPDRCRRASGAT